MVKSSETHSNQNQQGLIDTTDQNNGGGIRIQNDAGANLSNKGNLFCTIVGAKSNHTHIGLVYEVITEETDDDENDGRTNLSEEDGGCWNDEIDEDDQEDETDTEDSEDSDANVGEDQRWGRSNFEIQKSTTHNATLQQNERSADGSSNCPPGNKSNTPPASSPWIDFFDGYRKAGNTLFLVGTYSIGKEKVFLEVTSFLLWSCISLLSWSCISFDMVVSTLPPANS